MAFSLRDMFNSDQAYQQFRGPVNPYGSGTNAHYADQFDQAFGKGVWGNKGMLDQQSQFGARPEEIARRQGIVNDQHSRSNNTGMGFGGIQNTPGAMTGGFNQNSAGIHSSYNWQNNTPGLAQTTSTTNQNVWNTPDRQQTIKSFYEQNQGNPKAISDAMRQYGVSNQDFMTATGMDQAALDKYFSPVFGSQAAPASKAWMDKLTDSSSAYEDPETGITYMRTDNSGYNPYESIGGKYAVGKYAPNAEYSIYDAEGNDTGKKGKYGAKLGLGDPEYWSKILAVAGWGALGNFAAANGLGAAPAAAGGLETLPALAGPELGAYGATLGETIPSITAGVGGGSSALSLGSILKSAPTLAKVLTAVAGLTGTGGGGKDGEGSGGGIDLGGLDLGGITNILAGLTDAKRQGDAAKTMRSWLDSRMAYNDNMYKPDSPEAKYLWDEMSRKDAAAGRNSQYGPRSVDLAAKLAGLKMDANTRMTTGTSRAYADALNQNASKYAGLSSALQKAMNDGKITNLSSLVDYATKYLGENSGGGAPGTVPGGYIDPETGTRYNNPSAYRTPGYDNDGNPTDVQLDYGMEDPDDYSRYIDEQDGWEGFFGD